MGSQLRWLERTPDKREVDGSIPFEPTTLSIKAKQKYIENYIEKAKNKVNQYIRLRKSSITIQPKAIETMLNIEKIVTMKKTDKTKVKLQRAQGECLGTKSRRRT